MKAERPPSYLRSLPLLWLPQFINTAGFWHDPTSRVQLHTTVELCVSRMDRPSGNLVVFREAGQEEVQAKTKRPNVPNVSSGITLPFFRCVGSTPGCGRSPGLKLFCLEYCQYNNYKWIITFKICKSLYCTPITYIILYINYTSLKKLKKIK